jgi:hypothetical protein
MVEGAALSMVEGGKDPEALEGSGEGERAGVPQNIGMKRLIKRSRAFLLTLRFRMTMRKCRIRPTCLT